MIIILFGPNAVGKSTAALNIKVIETASAKGVEWHVVKHE